MAERLGRKRCAIAIHLVAHVHGSSSIGCVVEIDLALVGSGAYRKKRRLACNSRTGEVGGQWTVVGGPEVWDPGLQTTDALTRDLKLVTRAQACMCVPSPHARGAQFEKGSIYTGHRSIPARAGRTGEVGGPWTVARGPEICPSGLLTADYGRPYL